MTAGTIKSQGTELFLRDDVSQSAAEVVKFLCPTGLTGLGAGAKDQTETTCLDTLDDKTYVPGLGNPSAITAPFNFIPSAATHQLIQELKESGKVMRWLVAFSDGNAVPTLDGAEDFIAPAGRTSAEFDAYVAEAGIDVATNDIVKGTLSLQRSGPVVWHWNGPVVV